MYLVDTHAHLTWESFTDSDQVVLRARNRGVRRILTAGVDADSSRQATALAEQYDCVFAAVGIHPTDVTELDDMNVIAELAQHRRVVAIGETGLDYYRDTGNAVRQRERLGQHFELAQERNLPIVIHNRESDADVLAAVRSAEGQVRCVLHCFSSSAAVAIDALALGCHLSFAGNLTYRGAQALRDVAALAPADRILVETDSPFLSPVPKRGKRNEPANVAYTLEALAACRGADTASLTRQIAENARALFCW
jgi:TatD DNase family protein